MSAVGNISADTGNEILNVAMELRIIEATLLTLISVGSVVGNVSLWIVVLKSSALRTVTNMFILGLSLSDLFVATFNMPFTVYTIVIGYWDLDDTACQVTGFTNMLTLVTSVLSLCNISINRYFMVVRPSKFKEIYTVGNSVTMICVVTIVSVMLSAFPLMGWCAYAYIPVQSFCFADWKNSVSYSFFMITWGFGVPCIVMTVCNILILRTVRRSSRKIHQITTSTTFMRRNLSSPSVLNYSDTSCREGNTSDVNGQLPHTNTNTLHIPMEVKSLRVCQSNDVKSKHQNGTRSNTVFQKNDSAISDFCSISIQTVKSAWSENCDVQNDTVDNQPRTVQFSETSNVEKLKNRTVHAPNTLNGNSEPEAVSQYISSNSSDNKSEQTGGVKSPKFRRREEVNLARSLAIVVILFVLCWLPYCISMVMQIFADDIVPRGFHMFTLMIGYANSMCNPIIYGVMNKRFRLGYKKLFSTCIPCIGA